MSFSFYKTTSNKARSRDDLGGERNSMSVSFQQRATQDYEVEVVEERPSRFRIPFLGKKRKSMVTLRSSGPINVLDEGARPSRKTVSQLADETAARLARSHISPGLNLELPPVNVSSWSLNLNSTYNTPQKSRHEDRRSGLSSLSTTNLNSSNRHSTQSSKKLDKAKSSFFFRVTSRPLSSRNSSADLKSSVSQYSWKTPEKQAPARPRITSPVHPGNEPAGATNDLFMSPRAAPTPPSLILRSSETIHQSRMVTPSHSPYVVQSGAPVDLEKVRPAAQEVIPMRNQSHHYSTLHRLSTVLASPSVGSSRRFSSERSFPSPADAHALTPTLSVESTSGRSGTKRIGRENVTLSVVNVLEAGLGIEIREESEEEDEDEYLDARAEVSLPSRGSRQISDTNRMSTDLTSDDHQSNHQIRSIADEPDLTGISQDLSFGSLEDGPGEVKIGRPESTAASALETRSPLSVLMSTSNLRTNGPSTVRSDWRRQSSGPAPSQSLPLLPEESEDVTLAFRRTEQSLPDVSRITLRDDEQRLSLKLSDDLTELRRLLDFQGIRFDRVAKHLLSIIQRHEAEKLQYEKQLASLKKDLHRREREIEGLKHVIETSNSHSSRMIAKVPSIASTMSAAASLDDELLVDSNTSPIGVTTKDSRSSMDASPISTPVKEKRKAMALRRSKTMPQLQPNVGSLQVQHSPHSAISPSPDVSGLSLEFPMPEPLTMQSIASTILSSAPGSSLSVPALTTASTVESTMSDMTDMKPTAPLRPVRSTRRGHATTSARNRVYRPPNPLDSSASSIDVSASAGYAKSLNMGLAPSISQLIRTTDSNESLELANVFKKLAQSSEISLI